MIKRFFCMAVMGVLAFAHIASAADENKDLKVRFTTTMGVIEAKLFFPAWSGNGQKGGHAAVVALGRKVAQFLFGPCGFADLQQGHGATSGWRFSQSRNAVAGQAG